MSEDALAALQDRVQGRARNGDVSLQHFDASISYTLGGRVGEGEFSGTLFMPSIPGVCPPDGLPGVPIIFGDPEDVFAEMRLPSVIISREDISPAMDRWHSVGARQYRVSSLGALGVEHSGVSGYPIYEEKPQAHPFDITYDLKFLARHRSQANVLFMYALKVFPVYTYVLVTDTIGDLRSYEALVESTSKLDELIEVGDRMIGFGISLKVEAELDLVLPEDQSAVTQDPTLTFHST